MAWALSGVQIRGIPITPEHLAAPARVSEVARSCQPKHVAGVTVLIMRKVWSASANLYVFASICVCICICTDFFLYFMNIIPYAQAWLRPCGRPVVKDSFSPERFSDFDASYREVSLGIFRNGASVWGDAMRDVFM